MTSLTGRKQNKMLKSDSGSIDFPVFNTKARGLTKFFDMSDPKSRKEYFEAKAGTEIQKLKKFLEKNTFITYLLGKKNSGKGTYSKMLGEIIGPEKITHISVGDIVRNIEAELSGRNKNKELINFLKKNYRGFISVDETLQALSSRDTATLLPTEFILALLKMEIDKYPKKTLFIDGFPRDMDQISYSLFFRDLIGHRYDPDVFVLINVPTKVIDARIKSRVVCPKCHTPRGLKLQPTKEVRYDKKTKEFYLLCDNPQCEEIRMVKKEGDELGIKPIKNRLKLDEKLLKKASALHGIPKIFLRNSIPEKGAFNYVDKYEITPEYSYNLNKDGSVEAIEKPWLVKDDKGVESYSLMPPPVVVSLIKQLVKIFNL